MQRYTFRVVREVSYVEDVDITIATDEGFEVAKAYAASWGDGHLNVDWPVIERITIENRDPQEFLTIDVEAHAQD
jgi:hypothetical protein